MDRFVRKKIEKLIAGQKLVLDKEGCKNINGETVLKFSKLFQEKIDEFENRGYKIYGARVKFILYWFDKDTGEESLIVLPEITLRGKIN
jgi:ATP-dependent DNA helicase RecQ